MCRKVKPFDDFFGLVASLDIAAADAVICLVCFRKQHDEANSGGEALPT